MHHIHRNLNKGAISADSTLRRILAEYPNSAYAKSLRKEIGLQSASTEEDTVRSLFAEAERLLFDEKNPAGAIEKYRFLYENHPETEYAAKAFYAAAWAYENGLDSLHLAYVLYDSLLRKYPTSPFSEKVKKKVEAVKEDQARAKTGARAESAATGQPQPTAAAADSSSKNTIDSLGNAAVHLTGAGTDTAGAAAPPASGTAARAAAPGNVPPPDQEFSRPAGEKPVVDPDSLEAAASRAARNPKGAPVPAAAGKSPDSPPSKTDRE
jgi:hypothetical protein